MSRQAQRRIVLVTSNGLGLGHLSRAIAIALAIGDRAEVTMFTFSRGLPLTAQFGIRGEFCPGQSSPWIRRGRWNEYVEERFGLFVDEIRPDVVLFDGVAPYNGVINALRKRPSISAGWLRRGMWLSGPSAEQLVKSPAFDFIVEPGDIAGEADTGPTAGLASIEVPPVSLLEVVAPLNRRDAAAALGLDPDRPALLCGIGSGQPTDPVDARDAALERVLRNERWQVGLVTSPLADRYPDQPAGAVRLEGVYPLARYLNAFDAAISAAGYNSVHELVPARVPTLFVPKSTTRTDDQVARATLLARRRLALIAPEDDLEEIGRRIDDLLGDTRADLAENLRLVPDSAMVGGAAAVADLLTSSTPVGVRETGSSPWRQPGPKGMVRRILTPGGVEWVQRLVGRAPPRQSVGPVSLDPKDGSTPLLITSDPQAVSRSGDQPVEHLMEGASPGYRTAREDLIHRFYEMAR